MKYKRSTAPVQYKNRKLHDPSTQMAAEEQAERFASKDYIADLEKQATQQKQSLELWDRSLTKLSQSEVDAIGNISKTLQTAIGKDLVTSLGHYEKAAQQEGRDRYLNL